MTIPIQIPWDLYLGKIVVWCECLSVGVRRAVLLPRLDTIFAPLDEDPGRELPYSSLDWRLVSPNERDWQRYRDLVEKYATRYNVLYRLQRTENVVGWAGGRRVSVPQYHIWLYKDEGVARTIERLYEELDPAERRRLWRWLLAWTAPAVNTKPSTS
jgi:hypothetical protein